MSRNTLNALRRVDDRIRPPSKRHCVRCNVVRFEPKGICLNICSQTDGTDIVISNMEGMVGVTGAVHYDRSLLNCLLNATIFHAAACDM